MSEQRRNSQGRTRNRGNNSGGRHYSSQAPSQRKRSSDPARLVAFEVLRAVSGDDAYANLVLPQQIRRHHLNHQDAAFATELTYGTLRAQGTYDAVIAECVDRPLAKLDTEVLDVLRMGAHQLLNMRVPAHAALNSTVALVRSQVGAGPSGLVNAVLRKISEQTIEEWFDQLVADDDSETAMSLRNWHPKWIVRALRQALVAHGRDKGEITDLLTADNKAPELNLVALPGIGDIETAIEYGAHRGELAPGSAIYRGGDAGRIPGVKEGTTRVQDIGSQLCARAVVQPELKTQSAHTTDTAEKWLDLCAGPGGKATLLAALAVEHGAHLTANEPVPHRAELVRRSLAAVDESVWQVRAEDGRSIAEEHSHAFDRILVDAPCTGLGALRRRPESRWRRQPSDVANLLTIQRELLDAAVGALKPGGVLAYVTCSPHHAETLIQVDDVLKAHPELQLIDTAGALSAASSTQDGQPTLQRSSISGETADPEKNTAQLWPHVHSTDAMFIALFRLNGES